MYVGGQRRGTTRTASPSTATAPARELQVILLVAMPSPTPRRTDLQLHDVGQIELGVGVVPVSD